MLIFRLNQLDQSKNVDTCGIFLSTVSHTTDDLVFQWDPENPLDVSGDIELPQLELIASRPDDCTQVYSTGKFPLDAGLINQDSD